MDAVIILTMYGTLLLGGLLTAAPLRWHRFALVLLSIAGSWAVLTGIGVLPPVTTTWLLPAIPLFSVWFVTGTALALVVRLVQCGRPGLGISVFSGIIIGLALVGWPLGLGNRNLGEGWFAFPPLVAGVLLTWLWVQERRVQVYYLLGWVLVTSMVTLPQYLMALDRTELERSGASNGVSTASTAAGQLTYSLTIFYLAGSLLLLVLPLIARRWLPVRLSHARMEG